MLRSPSTQAILLGVSQRSVASISSSYGRRKSCVPNYSFKRTAASVAVNQWRRQRPLNSSVRLQGAVLAQNVFYSSAVRTGSVVQPPSRSLPLGLA